MMTNLKNAVVMMLCAVALAGSISACSTIVAPEDDEATVYVPGTDDNGSGTDKVEGD